MRRYKKKTAVKECLHLFRYTEKGAFDDRSFAFRAI